MKTLSVAFLILFSYLSFDLKGQVKAYFRPGLPGHSFVTVGDTVMYGFGNYLNISKEGTGLEAAFTDVGVIVKSRIAQKDTAYLKHVFFKVNGQDVLKFCDSVFNSTGHIPTTGFYANDSRARLAMKYKVFKYNCNAFVADAVGFDKKAVFPVNLKRKMQGKYVVTLPKVLVWTGFAVGGALWAGREAYHADPFVFEKKFGVGPYSFFGSRQWERNYEGNRYLNSDGQPNPHKTEIIGNFGRDYWHTAQVAAGAFVLSGTFIIGASDQKIGHKALDMFGGLVAFLVTSNLTYTWLRK